MAIAFVRTIADRSWSPRLASARDRPERTRTRSVESLLVEHRGSLLEQLDGAPVDDPRPPAGVLEADGSLRKKRGVLQLTRELCCGLVRRERRVGVSGQVAGRAELELHAAALRRVRDPELEGGAKQRNGSVERQRGLGGACCPHVVIDRPRGVADRAGGSEVVGEVCQRARVRTGVLRLDRLADPQVKLRSANPREAVPDGPANQLVREAIHEPESRHLLDQPVPDGLVERRRASPASSAGLPARAHRGRRRARRSPRPRAARSSPARAVTGAG